MHSSQHDSKAPDSGGTAGGGCGSASNGCECSEAAGCGGGTAGEQSGAPARSFAHGAAPEGDARAAVDERAWIHGAGPPMDFRAAVEGRALGHGAMVSGDVRAAVEGRAVSHGAGVQAEIAGWEGRPKGWSPSLGAAGAVVAPPPAVSGRLGLPFRALDWTTGAGTDNWKNRVEQGQANYDARGVDCFLSPGYYHLLEELNGSLDVALLETLGEVPSVMLSLSFHNGTVEQETLIATAWAFLRKQLDAVSYALSVVTAPHTASLELLVGIREGDFALTFRDDPFGGDYLSPVCVRRHRMSIYGPAFEEYLDIHAAAVAHGRVAQRMLVIMDLAANLLHEATHSYCVSTGDNWEVMSDEQCYNSYLVENLFRWCMLRRYAELSAQHCVVTWLTAKSGRADPDFMCGYNRVVYLVDGCS